MISVIIPVYNDPEGLIDTINSLLDQDTDIDYEIVPVNNNSTDQTGEVIEKYEKKFPEKVKGLEENDIQSSYAARNKGIENCEGEILCFLDADMWVKKDYLSEVWKFFQENPDVDYIGCDVQIVKEEDTIAALYDKIKGFRVEEYMSEKNFAPTCCLSVRREIFQDVGYFNDYLISGGDKDFGKRVKASSYRMEYAGDVTAYHPSRNRWTEIKDKYFRIGRGYFQKQRLNTVESEKDKVKLADVKSLVYKKPWKVGEKLENTWRLSRKELAGIYLVDVLKKISIFTGYYYERILN